MATIELYASKVNSMPSLIKDVKSSVSSLKSEILNMKTKTMWVDSSICDLDEVVNTVVAATKVQEDKVTALEAFERNSEQFIEDTARIDADVAELVDQRKDDFYDKYYYLKPECEKSGWEKFCDGCKKVGEWCKENWVTIVTAVVVVVVAVVAAVCGVAIGAIAAIAGLVALVLCVADIICMIATGGKGIADICEENGLGWLGQIFKGVSIGCDIVSIVFPLGASIKTMAQVGVKQYVKATISGIKIAFRETCEALGKNGFKLGFKTGMKNLGNILFKTFIFDIDDITKVENGKRVWNLMEDTIDMRAPTRNWTLSSDGTKLYPSDTVIPAKFNPDGLTMSELLEQYGNGAKYIPINKDGTVDLSGIARADSKISAKDLDLDIDGYLKGEISETQFSASIRHQNYKNAANNLPDGVSPKSLEQKFGIKLTPHEDFAMKKMYYVPSAIHENLGHTGAVARVKFLLSRIPKLNGIVGTKGFQYSGRLILEGIQ